jgi:hypothetical protein
MEDKLPIYKITIDPDYAEDGEDLGIEMIAFTKTPAILTKGMAFSTAPRQMSFRDDVKQRIVAPAMIPMEIYRNDSWGEYYVQFTAEEIERLHSKFMRTLSTRKNVFNLEHDANEISPAYILEAWLVGEDPKADRSYSEFGIDVPSGTLMLVAQVTDTEYYKELVQAERTGFSIEGILGMSLSEILKKKHKHNMKSYKKRYSARFAETGTDESLDLTVVADEIAPDQSVIVIDETLTPVEDWTGEVVIDGETVTIENGVITEVATETTEEVEMAEEEITEEVSEEEETTSTYAITPEEQTAIVTELMQIIEPKFEEIYNMIAEVKSAMAPEEAPVEASTEQKMSLVQKLSAVEKFLGLPTIN